MPLMRHVLFLGPLCYRRVGCEVQDTRVECGGRIYDGVALIFDLLFLRAVTGIYSV